MEDRTTTFQRHKPRLYGIAYRMLGSKADAEDMVQEAYLRWHQTDVERVRAPGAWLTTTVTRLCIDRLRSAQTERTNYVGPWLPEPLIGEPGVSPDRAELAADLSVALLVVLERLAPEERAAFLLHETFDCPYPEIARVLGKNESTCRQIVHRARERVHGDRPRFHVTEAARRRLLERFILAVQTSDQESLLRLFADDATWMADGGGKADAVRKVLHGAAPIAKLVSGFGRLLERREGITLELEPINGITGIVARVEGTPVMALSIDTDGVRILAAYNVLNPDKLKTSDIVIQ